MPLEPELWNRLKEIVASALELPTSERISFLKASCEGDEKLFAEANSLLHYSTEARNSPGRLLKNRYQIVSELARGGFAITYTAIDRDLHDRKVVVKMLSSLKAQDESYLYRKFQDEIHALSVLEHPNIVIPLDCGRTEDNEPFLVMQFVEGRTLRALMKDGPLKRDTISSVLQQLGYALAFAHEHGVIHRDVKPENIMVQSFAEGTVHVRLIDFGIASVAIAADDMRTRIIGTAAYMAPEQFYGKVSPRSDIFAVGVLAYELLSGRQPFGSDNPMQIMERQRNGRFAEPSEDTPELDSALDTILKRALAFDPEKRPREVSSFVAEVADALQVTERRNEKRILPWPMLGVAAVVGCVCLAAVAVLGRKPLAVSAPERPMAVAPVEHSSAPKHPEAAAQPTLARVTLERDSSPNDVTADDRGIIEMKQQDRFRLHVQASSEGHLYTFARSLESSDFHVLFPSPTSNRGLSFLTPYRSLTIPSSNWFSFGEAPGTETLALIWSAMPEPLLEEAKTFANTKDKGAVPEGPVTHRILEMMSLPNSLKQVRSEFQLAGEKEACGWLTLRHR